MLAPTLPDLSKLDREALQTLLRAEHQERIATQQRLLSRESEIEHLKLLLSQMRPDAVRAQVRETRAAD